MSRLYIDKDTLVMAINESLVYWGGGTFGKIVFDLLIETNVPVYAQYEQQRFFQPFKTKEDLLNIYSPITAPLVFSILAAEMALGFMIYAINTLILAVTSDVAEVKENASVAGQALLNTILFCAAAVISPIVCLADVIGSGIKTGLDACNDADDVFYIH